ncbi:MAG: hypothetical protein K5644_00620 [Lachnospiraceae bacterium]|nr:hypothetical protein [Lachnospiraceae bacterium]
MKQSFINMGFTDYVTDYTLLDPWLAYGIAKKDLEDGSTLVLIVARGTDSGREFISNLNVHGLTNNRHKGFSDAANSLQNSLADFLGTNNFNDTKFKYVLTGHSRGAAATNLLAANLIDSGVQTNNIVAYNFACPDVEKMIDDKAEALQYSSIFNIGNCNDFVTWVPSIVFEDGNRSDGEAYWNKYGKSYWYSEN